MERYKNGKIYKLVNDCDDEEYVGSTCLPLAKRKSEHKSRAKKDGDRKVYSHLNDIGWENVKIVLIEEYPCENKMELERRERYWIETLQPSLNKHLPTRTDKERYAENPDKVREKHAKYRAENPDKERERHAKYYAENREKRLESQANYSAENADKIREYKAKYRAENRDAINQRARERRAKKKEEKQGKN